MKKVLVAGATGSLGTKVLKELKDRKYFVRALASSSESADKVRAVADEVVVGDASKMSALDGICDGIDVVFSSVGKSVSLFSSDEQTFFEGDYLANKNILDQAKEAQVERFVYISIYGSHQFGDFELASVHRHVEQEMAQSGLGYTIIRPVGLFSGLLDVLRMAQLGAVLTVGEGENKTNPIYEGDLAIVCVDHLEKGPEILEVGGPVVYTRNQIAEMAIRMVGNALHFHVPETFVEGSLPLLQFYDQNFFDKLAFFKTVLTHDAVVPQYGSKRLEEYFSENGQG